MSESKETSGAASAARTATKKRSSAKRKRQTEEDGSSSATAPPPVTEPDSSGISDLVATPEPVSKTEKVAALLSDYGKCFGSEAGLAVLRDLEQRFHVRRSFLSARADGHLDAYALAAAEGQRDAVLYIRQMVDKARADKVGRAVSQKKTAVVR